MLNINYSEKINKLKLTVKVSLRLLGLLWSIDKKLLIANGVAMMIPAFMPFVYAYIFKLLIDHIVVVVAGGEINLNAVTITLASLLGAYTVQNLSYILQDYFNRLIYSKVPISLYGKVLSKISSLDMAYFEDPEFRNTLEKVKDSYHWRPLNMMESLFFGFQSLVQIVVAVVILSKLSVVLILAVVLLAIPEFITRIRESQLSWGIWDAQSRDRKKFWYVSDLLQQRDSVKELKIFHLPNWFLNEVRSLQERIYKENKALATKYLILSSLFGFFANFSYLGAVIFIIYKAITQKITIGDVGYYTTVLGSFSNGIGGVFRNVAKIFSESLYVSSVFEVLDAKPKIIQPKNPVKLNLKKSPEIEFKNVSFVYPSTKDFVLKDFNLKIKPGEKIAFVGENGAGKSTIIKLLARFYDVTKGQILINGIDIKNINLEEWYKDFGVLFQDFVKYEYTAKENIRFGKITKEMNMKKIIDAATSSGADPLIKKFEKGYDQMLGRTFEEGIELSAGQWQKVALARGFLKDAKILVLDEPTSVIDAKAETEIFNKVEKLSRDKTVIIISHRFSTVRNADKIYVIDEGKIIEEGTHEALMKHEGQYATLFNLQAKGYR